MTALILFVVAFFVLFLGYPIWFSFAAVALAVGSLASGVDFSQLPYMFQSTTMGNSTLMAIPMFIFMGVVLQRTGLAEKLLESMGKLFGPVPGGLAISTVIVGAFLAAATGVVGATVVAMGVISLPVMMKYNYSPKLATGVICAAGTLGQIIPPSIILIILSEVTFVDLGVIFGAAIQPGLMLVGAYLIYIVISTNIFKRSGPRLPPAEDGFVRLLIVCLINILPTLMLIGLVLGSILEGWATATESSAVGAIGSLLLAFFFSFIFGLFSLKDNQSVTVNKSNDRLALVALVLFLLSLVLSVDYIISLMELYTRQFDRPYSTEALFKMFDEGATLSSSLMLSMMGAVAGVALVLAFVAMIRYGYTFTPLNGIIAGFKGIKPNVILGAGKETVKVSSMVYAVIIGAIAFSTVFNYAGGKELFTEFVSGLPGGEWSFILLAMAMVFFLGFFIDFVEIAYIIVPILIPVADALGLNMTWFAILIAMNLQTSFMTPPFGFSLFYLKGVAPPELKTTTIYKGVIPFIIIQAIIVFCLVVFPTWFGFESIYANGIGPNEVSAPSSAY